MIDKSHIDPNALSYYRMLKDAGFSAYFVGGSVRDLLLGKTPKDFDIATNATPHQIKRVIPYGRIIGRRFRHVMLERDGGRYEIVTFRGPIVHSETPESEDESTENEAPAESQESGEEVDVQDKRAQQPDLNQFGNAEQDAKRRDFTINALFYDPDADELVDYVDGKQDIDQHMIRTIGDPFVRMEEDPIRILRAIRHKTKLSLTYDQGLRDAMISKAPLLEHTSKDRIREEFLKICNDYSIGMFLNEAKGLGILLHCAPWFADVPEEDWEQADKLWVKFAELGTQTKERPSPDVGLALMFTALVRTQVLEPYKAAIPPEEKNYLPDMKFFLGCENLRNFMLRNLRISRAQTDHLLRALFYWSRMTGLWLENGPPRRIIGRLHQHPPALLAAKIARITLTVAGKESPDWINELADYDPRVRRQRGEPRPANDRAPRAPGAIPVPREDSQEGRDSQDMGDDENGGEEFRPAPRHQGRGRDRDREVDREEPPLRQSLPPPEHPMVWNGPLHMPALRPSFAEEPLQRWARKNQTVRAYRPSGLPNPPTDYALLKSHLVTNYKPELETVNRDHDDEQPRQHRDNRERGERGDRGGRNRDRGERGRGPRNSGGPALPVVDNAQDMAETAPDAPPESMDQEFAETSIPAVRLSDDDIDDNIGNRLDAPPTSGHVGVNGDGVLGGGNRQPDNRPRQGGGQNRGGGRFSSRGRGGGGRNRNSSRRGGGGGFPPRGTPPAGGQ